MWIDPPKVELHKYVCTLHHRWTVSNIKSVPFGHKWTISAHGITINNPVVTLMRTSINFVTKQIYNHGIVKWNPRCIYSPLVSKRDTFMLLTVYLWFKPQQYSVRLVLTLFRTGYYPISLWRLIMSKMCT